MNTEQPVTEVELTQGTAGEVPLRVSDLLCANVEALLFVSEEPLSFDRMAEALEGTEREAVRRALEELRIQYLNENRGLQIIEIAGGYQLCTKNAFADSIKRLLEKRRKRTLSGPALETLAIIAYKQPITRAEIEEVRGVDTGGILRTLLEKNLIKIAGKKDVPGKPLLYSTTPKFLALFGLKNLKDLPALEDIQQIELSSLPLFSLNNESELVENENLPPEIDDTK